MCIVYTVHIIVQFITLQAANSTRRKLAESNVRIVVDDSLTDDHNFVLNQVKVNSINIQMTKLIIMASSELKCQNYYSMDTS